MGITLLGPNGSGALLAGRGRITVVNRTDAESAVAIVAIAIARHRDGSEAQTDAAYNLEINADQSVTIEAAPPLSEAPDAAEVVLRLRIGTQGAMVDAYSVAHRAASDTTGWVEVGIKPNSGVLVDGEDTVPGFAEFVIYALAAG